MRKKQILITTQTNNKTTRQLLSEIRGTTFAANIIAGIDDVIDKLKKQAPSPFESCINTDAQISEVVENVRKAIESGTGTEALHLRKLHVLVKQRDRLCPHMYDGLSKEEIKQRKIADKVNLALAKKRDKLIKKGKPIDSTYSDEERIKIKTEEVLAEIDGYKARSAELIKRLTKNPKDELAIREQKALDAKYIAALKRYALLNDEARRIGLVQQIQDYEREYKDLIGARTVSDDELDVLVQNHVAMLENAAAGSAHLDDIEVKLRGVGTSSTVGVATAGVAASEVAAASAGYDISMSPLVQDLGGMPDPKDEAIKSVLANIESTIAAMRSNSAQFDRDKQKYDEEIEVYEMQLRALKPKYEMADASQSKSVADEIKTINTQRIACIRNRDRVIRAKDQLNKQLEIAMGLKGIKDIEIAKKRASEMFGQQFDLESWAMFMKDYDKAENKALEDMEVYRDVANSESINQTSLFESAAQYESEVVKDEHQFDALWTELEVRRNANKS